MYHIIVWLVTMIVLYNIWLIYNIKLYHVTVCDSYILTSNPKSENKSKSKSKSKSKIK